LLIRFADIFYNLFHHFNNYFVARGAGQGDMKIKIMFRKSSNDQNVRYFLLTHSFLSVNLFFRSSDQLRVKRDHGPDVLPFIGKNQTLAGIGGRYRVHSWR